MIGRQVMAIEIGRRHVQAVAATIGRDRVRLRHLLRDELPDDLEAGDAAAVGAWVGRRLTEARFPRCRAVIALSREHVGLKRIMLPTVDAGELPEMTRLAMQRDLPFDAASAVIDFVPVGRSESSTTVLAVAVPRTILAESERLARAAGVAVERISLRAMGAAALSREREGSGAGPGVAGGGALVIDIGPESVEFSVVVDGAVRFSRAAELPRASGREPLFIAEAVITETRRTWMSYRIVEDSNDVREALVMGEPDIADAAAPSIGEMLQVPTTVLRAHPQVECRPPAAGAGAGGEDGTPGAAWPLAGLLLEAALERPSIDFASPRKAPDLAARRRQRILAAAGAIIIGLLAVWTLGRLHLQSLRAELDQVTQRQKQMVPERLRFKRDVLKATHLDEWGAVHMDWIDHLAHVASLAPPPDRVVLGRWSGTLEFAGVRWDQSAGWSAPRSAVLLVEGEARDRATADAVREALVRDEVYRAQSAGADAAGGRRLPVPFRFMLKTTCSAPSEYPEGGAATARSDSDPPRSARRSGARRAGARTGSAPGAAPGDEFGSGGETGAGSGAGSGAESGGGS